LAELFSSVEDLVAVLERPKRLIIPCFWVKPGKNGLRGLRLRASLQDEAAAIRGVSIEIGCNIEGFDLPVRVVLLAEVKNKPRAMARIDINGSRHENLKAICGDLQFLDAGLTHFHDPRLHRGLTIEQLFNGDWDLPVARQIDDMPEKFPEAMEKCGELLHIENLREIEEPQWQPKLLPF